MPQNYLALLLCLTLLSASAQANDLPNIADVISEISPKQSTQPIEADKRWEKVDRVHVLIPSFFQPQQIDDFENWLEKEIGADVVLLDSAQQLNAQDSEIQALVGWCQRLPGTFPNLVWLQNLSAGVEGCTDLPQFHNDRVIVTNGAAASGPAIAEWVIGSLFLMQRRLVSYAQEQANSHWVSDWQAIPPGTEISGKTILVVGLGGIGRQIAWRAKGLGMRVIATRNSSRNGPDYVDYVGLSDELMDLAQQADVVVNAAPLTPKTEGIFNKTFFENMKDHAIFMNVGRGGSVVQPDLIAALKAKIIAGAALDVTSPEPLPESSELWALDNVFITPHQSSRTVETSRRRWIFMRENLRRLVAGETVFNLVDLDQSY